MHKKVTLEGLLAGYAAESVNSYGCEDGEKSVDMITRDFLTSEDGFSLIRQLDQLWPILLSPAGLNYKQVASIERLLAILHRDSTADIYINEPNMVLSVHLKMTVPKVNKGQLVDISMIEHITEVNFEGIQIPKDCGFIWIFSFGWRKGYFFDVGPLGTMEGKPASERDYPLAAELANAYSYLMNQELLHTDSATWEELFKQDWFPFVALPDSLRQSIVNTAKHKWPLSQIEAEVSGFLLANLETIRKVLLSSSILANHKAIVGHALDRFAAEDFVSAVSIVVPRIEGVMRDLFVRLGDTRRPKQDRLISTLLNGARAAYHKSSPTIPDRFSEYLEKVFFEDFKHDSSTASDIVSRHTFLHGIARPEYFNRQYATISILTLMQIVSYADRMASKQTAQVVL